MIIIMSCDDNPYYFDFWEPVSFVWKEKMGHIPVLAHFGEKKPSQKYGIVVSMETNSEVPVHTQCQLSRLWIPKLFSNELCVTSDIDMFPASKKYWDSIELENSFHSFVEKVLRETENHTTHQLGFGGLTRRGIDEEYSSAKIVSRRDDLKVLQPPRPGGFPNGHRIDRLNWNYDADKLKNGEYIDCHSLRPFSWHKEEIMKLVDLI